MRGLILEGVTGSGKSTVIRALEASLLREAPGVTKLLVSEHYTERLFEDVVKRAGGAWTEILSHGMGLCERVEWLYALQHGSKFEGRRGNSEVYVILERFLGGHYANLCTYGGPNDLPGFVERAREILGRMTQMGLQMAVLTLDTKYLTEAIEDTRHHRNNVWATFLDGLGPKHAITEHFARWQGSLLDFVEQIRSDVDVRIYRVGSREELSSTASEICGSLWQR